MTIRKCIAGASTFCFLGGCSGVVDSQAAVPRDAPPEVAVEDAGATKNAPHGDPSTDTGPAELVPLIRGHVSGAFPPSLTPSECQPLGFPMGLLSEVFRLDAVVQEVATPISATECWREQVLDAGANTWATVAYQMICSGRGGASTCGAQATRLCSVETMLNWADQRGGESAATDSLFHFTYVVTPLSEASRKALYQRTLNEAGILLTEGEVALVGFEAGERDCPDEDYASIAAVYADTFDLFRRISEALNGIEPTS